MKAQKVLQYVVVFVLLITVSCKKYEDTICYPQEVKMLVGQKCVLYLLPKEYKEYNDGLLYHYLYNVKVTPVLQLNDTCVLSICNDTIMALSEGESEVAMEYIDKFGTHNESCLIEVTKIDIPTDTIYAQDGDTIVFINCDVPSGHPIDYEFEYGNPYHFDSGRISKSNDQWISLGGCAYLSPLSRYKLQKKVTFDMIGVHVYCESLNIDFRIPIVVSERDKTIY